MKFEFYLYWAFYLVLFMIECLIPKMSIELSYCILVGYWISYMFLGAIFGYYLYLEIPYKNIYAEGLIVAFISRSMLQIISIFGYQDKKSVIVVTGFVLMMWVSMMASRKIKNKINAIEKTLL